MAQKHATQHVPNSNERKGIDAAIIQLASIVESSGDAIFGETLQAVITSWNSQDSLKAMELAQELHPCAIMLDVMMPDLNGWQILHQLKENPATAAIPVMMITVLTEPTTGYVLGADAYLIKPFKTTVLLNTLGRLLASQKGQSQAGEREAQQV